MYKDDINKLKFLSEILLKYTELTIYSSISLPVVCVPLAVRDK